MKQSARPDLASIADDELRRRLKQRDWPADDIAAWRVIAELLRHGTAETELTWSDLMAALRTAEARRIDAVIAAKGTPKLPAMEQRLGNVVAIRRTIERSAWRHFQCFPERSAA